MQIGLDADAGHGEHPCGTSTGSMCRSPVRMSASHSLRPSGRPPRRAALGQPEKICHRDDIAGLPLTPEMVTDGSIAGQCGLPTFAVHSKTIIPKKVLSDHSSNGNPTYCSANDAWACSETCR